MIHRENVRRHRMDVQSAMYFLVWHCGMSIDSADAVLCSCRPTIRHLAAAGRREGNRCFTALSKWIDRVQARAALRGRK